ncbi:MAG: YabP/YqfC family sporulation protein [Clostridia bacterium]|nr:YabP/YqfC family sporulation protein [Clostridia bacterium]
MRKKNKTETKNRLERFADALEMPKDVISNCSKITTYNDNQIIIENYKGILEYTDEKIRIKTPNKILCLSGLGLFINAITDTDILIEGKFHSVGWE